MMRDSNVSPSHPQRSLHSLVVSVVVLLVLVADPRLFLKHAPAANSVGMNIVGGLRLWLVCLAICYAMNRLIELVMHRTIRHSWAYILVWSAIIPPVYALTTYHLERRWPVQGQRDLLLLGAMALVTAFGGFMLKRLAESVTRTVQFDHLTGLPNRVLLNDRLAKALDRARRVDRPVAVCLMNIDRFKRINDSLGHAGGDAVLIHVAQQLSSVVGANGTVARIGSDEFVVILPDVAGEAYVTEMTNRLLNAISQPVMVGEREVCVTASLGHCLFPQDAGDGPSLLHAADASMYKVKNLGRDGVSMYPSSARWLPAERMELEEDFRHALANNELQMFYQPQIRLATGEVTGMEALLRWHSPKRGNIPPGDFLSIAEEVGLMIPVGEWALKQCCQDCVDLQNQTGRPLTMSLNLSARQFAAPRLALLIERALAETGLRAAQLELEITEQMLMVNSPHTLATMAAIRSLGVSIAIDDFGTGFSSFSYILQYHVDRIKIDQSFVARSIDDPNAMAIVRTIIAMAHGLNMRVVAEGVETQEQSDFLMRRRCDEAQGYLFARPMPKRELAAAIERIVMDVRHRTTDGPVILSEFDEAVVPKSSLPN